MRRFILVVALMGALLSSCTSSKSTGDDDRAAIACSEPENRFDEGTGHHAGYEWAEDKALRLVVVPPIRLTKVARSTKGRSPIIRRVKLGRMNSEDQASCLPWGGSPLNFPLRICARGRACSPLCNFLRANFGLYAAANLLVDRAPTPKVRIPGMFGPSRRLPEVRVFLHARFLPGGGPPLRKYNSQNDYFFPRKAHPRQEIYLASSSYMARS